MEKSGNKSDDDPELGPMYQRKGRFTEKQLLSFARHLAQLRFEFAENPDLFEQENPGQSETIRKILFDEKLLRAQLMVSQKRASKNVLLRMLQRFITVLKLENVFVAYDDWFFISPTNL